MYRRFLQAKLHRVSVTASELHYEGSCAVDKVLLQASGLLPFQEVEIWNVTNGERFSTYLIEAPAHSGTISVNGSAARRAQVGDLLIIAAFASYNEVELAMHTPVLVFVDEQNKIKDVR